MSDDQIAVNYVRWRLGNSHKCEDLLARCFNRFVVNLCFLLNSGQSATGPVVADLLHAQIWSPKVKTRVCNCGQTD